MFVFTYLALVLFLLVYSINLVNFTKCNRKATTLITCLYILTQAIYITSVGILFILHLGLPEPPTR